MRQFATTGEYAQAIAESEIDERKEFLEFGASDILVLEELHAHLQQIGVGDELYQTFYKHILNFAPVAHLISDDAVLARMKLKLDKHFDELTKGKYDFEYVLNRRNVGHTHHQIGLDLKWYIGAYRKYLSTLLPTLQKIFEDDKKSFVALDALLKVVFLDMGLAIDSYLEVDKMALYHLANHDALTGLPNRNLLSDRLAHSLRSADRDGTGLGVLVLDLDNIKTINDSLGHLVGDQVILAVAAKLKACLRDNDTVARWGGDEFVIVLENDRQGISTVANKILQSIRSPLLVNGTELYVTASIGIAIYPMDGADQKELMKNADTAMYLAKGRGGRNTFRYYQPEMNDAVVKKLKLEMGLRHALERKELLLHYLPQIDTVSGEIIELEALLRWQTEDGLISSDQIIPVADETGLIVSIGEWVLETACRQVVAMHNAGHDKIRMAVNVSERQFRQNDFVEMVGRILAKTECEPSWLQIEITESMMMGNPDESLRILQALSAMGVKLAVDDFGTGYSSLSYLKRIPIDYLKIDRSFVNKIAANPDDASIVNAVISLGGSLGLKVIAEGVENTTQLDFLRNHGCHLAQGFYFHEPKSAHEIEQIMLS